MGILEPLKKVFTETETLTRSNIIRLALISAFLTSVDTIQSFYFQKVLNVFNEANIIPGWFYSYGYLGYIIYTPIEFTIMFATLLILWAWASYVLWYLRNVTAKRNVDNTAIQVKRINSES